MSTQDVHFQPPRAYKQPRGRATPQLVAENEQVASLLLHEQPVLDNKRCLTAPCKHVPAGSKLLRSEKKGKKTFCVSLEFFIHVRSSSRLPDHCGALLI